MLDFFIGSTRLVSGGPNSLTIALDVILGHLSFRQIVDEKVLAWEVRVANLGLEDVLLLDTQDGGSVKLAIRLRAVSFYGVEADSQAQARSLIIVQMDPISALSFLSCLAFGLAKLAMPSDNEKDRLLVISSLCSVIRKGLARRDLLNRGWTDAQLAEGSTLLRLLSVPDANRVSEKHNSTFLSCLSRDARQFRYHHHAKDFNATPNPVAVAQPPRMAFNVPDALSSIQLLANAPIFEDPSSRKREMDEDEPVVASKPLEKPKVLRKRRRVFSLLIFFFKTGYQVFHKAMVKELKKQDPGIKHQVAFKK